MTLHIFKTPVICFLFRALPFKHF